MNSKRDKVCFVLYRKRKLVLAYNTCPKLMEDSSKVEIFPDSRAIHVIFHWTKATL